MGDQVEIKVVFVADIFQKMTEKHRFFNKGGSTAVQDLSECLHAYDMQSQNKIQRLEQEMERIQDSFHQFQDTFILRTDHPNKC